MGTLTCKIRQRVQKLPGEKSRCFAQKQRKLESFKIKVPSLRGSFNQRARDSSSLERTNENLRLTVKRYELVVGFLLFIGTKRSGKCDKNATNHEEMVMKECSLHN